MGRHYRREREIMRLDSRREKMSIAIAFSQNIGGKEARKLFAGE